MCYASTSIGSKLVPATPEILSHLYKSACLPKLCYGVETMDISDKTLDSMEAFHVKNAKLFQGLLPNACNIGSLLLIGWCTISARIDISRLLFMWRILTLPMDCIYKCILIRRILQLTDDNAKREGKGPVYKMVQICSKYNLLEFVLECITCADYLNVKQWKRMVYDVVLRNDKKRLNVSSMMYKSLGRIKNNVTTHTMIGWWKHAKYVPTHVRYCRIVINLLLNTYRLGRENCKLCLTSQRNSIEHILFVCPKLQETREVQLQKVRDCNPKCLVNEINDMCIPERTRFILNAFYCNYVTEWMELYKNVLNFINITLNQYHTLNV